MRALAWEAKLPTRRPFVISTGATTAVRSVFVRLEHGDGQGSGEAAPSLRVAGETPEGVRAFLAAMDDAVRGWDPARWKPALDDLAARAPGNPAAKAALETALLDLAGQAAGKPLHRLLGLPPAERPTSATVVLDDPGAMAAEALRHAEAGFTHLKLKLGEPRRDLARVRAVRDAVPSAVLRCDANTGWTEAQALRLGRALDKLEVELLEQPVPRGRWDSMRRVAKALETPVLADEDVLGMEDLARLAEVRYADGFVLKLAKCGGPWQGARMLALARKAGLEAMVGCMVESSLGITAASHLLARVAWADLDGAWLLAEDPWRGAAIRDGRIGPPADPGVGATPRDGIPSL